MYNFNNSSTTGEFFDPFLLINVYSGYVNSSFDKIIWSIILDGGSRIFVIILNILIRKFGEKSVLGHPNPAQLVSTCTKE